jgi:hypothetical protein
MLERVKDLPAGVTGLRASGKVSSEDYERVVRPLLEEARPRRATSTISLSVHARVRGLHRRRSMGGRSAGIALPATLRGLRNRRRRRMDSRIRSARRRAHALSRAVVEVKSALRAEDFDGLSAMVDAWIEAHGELHGIVVHAREFHGWENVTSFVHDLRFVRDHDRNVRRVALAAGGRMAKLAPRLAEHFVEADVKHFDYDALDQAIAWAKRQ